MKRIGEYIFDGVGLLILILIWIGLWILFWPPMPYHLLGGVFCLSVGVMSSFYHYRHWDWHKRRWRDQRRSLTSVEALGFLVPLAVAAGGLTARYGVVENLLGKPLNEFLVFSAINWLGIFLTYGTIQDWHHS